jgi:DNA-binding helix-hairpin-helix protein with protein kinase domain/Tfp pilus assembly protein PilF
MNKIFYNSDAEIIRTGEPLGAGGEGAVFEVKGRCDLAAKIYHKPISTEKSDKLLALSRLGTGRLIKLSAWPIDILRARPGGDVVGFVMKRINEGKEVHALHSPKSRLQTFPEASWSFLVYVAANIVRAIATIHEHGFVIGDVNPKNILVTRRATIFLLDCDSFQVSAGGKFYRCEGGFPEYTPPELQGVALSEVTRAPAHDSFGLAVAVFQLLFLGRHPFSGLYLGEGEMSLMRAIREQRFAYGADSGSRDMKQPPGALSMDAIPEPIAELFRRAFLSAAADERPKPQEWIAPLESLATSLKKCGLHSGHHYFRELPECPWCGIETGARIRLFNFPLNGKARKRVHFKLDEVWQEISSISPPPATPSVHAVSHELLEPSDLGLKALRERSKVMILSLVIAIIAGFVIGLTTASIFTLALAGVGVAGFARYKGWRFFRFKSSKVHSPIVAKIQTVMREADENVRELEKKWEAEATDERFIDKFAELQKRKETYERIPQIRQSRLDILETNGDGVTHRARISVEKEIDELRNRLEYELSSGAFYLNRVKSQIEDSRQRLLPSLMSEKQSFAQATKDWEVATRKNSRRVVILILLIGFFIGSYFRLREQERPRNRPVTASGQTLENSASKPKITKAPVGADSLVKTKVYPADMSSEAIELYNQGKSHVDKGNFVEAVNLLQKSVDIDSRLDPAWQQLGFAHYRLGNYDLSLHASNMALSIKESFGPLYTIGLVHVVKKDWRDAKECLSRAVNHCSVSARGKSCALASEYLARSIYELREAKEAIQEIEKNLRINPDMDYERFKLAFLHHLDGDRAAAEQQFKILGTRNPMLAHELDSLMRSRNVVELSISR